MNDDCEFGCFCDGLGSEKYFDPVLAPEDLARLIQEKISRARRYKELQEVIGGQLETD